MSDAEVQCSLLSLKRLSSSQSIHLQLTQPKPECPYTLLSYRHARQRRSGQLRDRQGRSRGLDKECGQGV